MPEKKDCSFLLKDTKANELTSINFHMTCPDGRVKRSIGEMILPTDWDFAAQRASGTGKPARKINQLIEAIIAMIPGLKSECRRNNRVISKADVHGALDVILQDKRPEKPATYRDMITDIKSIIQDMKDGKVLTPGKNKTRYSAETIGNYEQRSLPKLREYYNDRKLPAAWEKIDIGLYNDFLRWCHSKDLSNNSIGMYISCWKRVGKIALNNGWHSNNIFKDEEFMTLQEDTPDIYLDENKIELLYRHKLTSKEHDIARDWAVLDAYLGLRISDLKKVSKSDFAGDLFQFVNQKTGAHVAIPIHPFAKEILNKWGGLPPAIQDYLFRSHVKTVAKEAGLKDKFVYVVTKGGQVKSFEYEEWECVSPHTFRRSFITNLLKIGVPHAHVMKLAGIKRYETLMRYFKQTNLEVAKEMGQHDFFKRKS
jgi:site-specific recombinase XerD